MFSSVSGFSFMVIGKGSVLISVNHPKNRNFQGFGLHSSAISLPNLNIDLLFRILSREMCLEFKVTKVEFDRKNANPQFLGLHLQQVGLFVCKQVVHGCIINVESVRDDFFPIPCWGIRAFLYSLDFDIYFVSCCRRWICIDMHHFLFDFPF